MVEILSLLIPLLALLIPIIALTGHYVIQPLTKALGRLADQQQQLFDPRALQRELAELSERTEAIERTLGRVVEEQAFQRALQEPPQEGARRGARLPPS
jgi:hypothetical protein